nr:hypothetical protein [Tanacetum cinerariifolium]
MADMSTPFDQAPAGARPVRADEEIVPHIRWVQIGKRPLLLLPPYRQYTSSSSGIPSNMTRKLETTCVSWMNTEVLVDFVNQLGYPKLVRNVSNIVTNDMFQPWRALTTIINLCLTGKTSGFERPRAPVLQILWGIVTQSNIDYAERIKEEFTQSIHTFIKDKRNLFRHTTGKKRATLIVIPSIRFTKLIIHHLQRRHKFHPRPDSPLHLSSDEPILGYHKFSAKGTKRKVFGMPIPGSLITQTSKELPTTRIIRQMWPSIEVSTPVASAQPVPTLALAKPQENKRKQAMETSDKPAKAKRVKHSAASKTRKPRSPPKSVAASEAEEGGNDEDQAGPDPGAQAEGQTGKDADTLDEGQAGSNPDDMSEGQAGPDPGNTKNKELSVPNLVVHTGLDREHMDLDVADISPQPFMEQLDEGFIAMAYPKVQESLKLAVEEHVLLEEPASSSGTLSSLQHLIRDISFGDQFFSDKPLDTDKNAETEIESMVNVLIQQALSSISQMTSPIIDLTLRLVSPKETECYKTHEEHTLLFKALEKSINRDHSEDLVQDLTKARKKKKKHRESPKTPPGSPPHQPPPPPPLPTGPSRPSRAPRASGSSQVPPPLPPTSLPPSNSHKSPPSSSKTVASALASNYSPPPKDSLLVQIDDMATFIDWFSKRQECHKLLTNSVDDPILRNNVSKPLPLGGPPGQVTILYDFFFNKDLDYPRYGSKGKRLALSISKMKAAYYPDARLEQMAPDKF